MPINSYHNPLAKINKNIMKVYIKQNTDYSNPIRYVLRIIEKNINIKFNFVDSIETADLVWDHLNPESQIISQNFYTELKRDNPNLTHVNLFDTEPVIIDDNGKKDYFATIFYMINSLQEYTYTKDDLDQFGRFKYKSSYQYRFNIIEENIVQKYIDVVVEGFDIKKTEKKKSVFFISHDIDTIYGSFLQDGLWAVKNLRIDAILTILVNELIRKPHWKNIDKIIRIDSEYDIRSTFFWLVNQGIGTKNIKNADYSIDKEQGLLSMVRESGFVNGLHKSCSEMSINEELEKANIQNAFNRYHFFNFLPSKDWKKISDSKLDFDSSLGFVERYGYRNSYGMAFQPYNIEENQLYNFVEAPLNFMDGTFHKYMKIKTGEIGDIIIEFFEQNQYESIFSMLWHNTYFTDYKYNSFLKEYKKVIAYIYENKIDSLTPGEIVKQNKLQW